MSVESAGDRGYMEDDRGRQSTKQPYESHGSYELCLCNSGLDGTLRQCLVPSGSTCWICLQRSTFDWDTLILHSCASLWRGWWCCLNHTLTRFQFQSLPELWCSMLVVHRLEANPTIGFDDSGCPNQFRSRHQLHC